MSVAYITEPGTFLAKKGGKIIAYREKAVVATLPMETLEGIVIMGGVQLSSRLIIEFLMRNLPVTWISAGGKWYGRLESQENVHVLKQQQQILQQHTPFSLQLSKKIIMTKIQNQIVILRRYNRTANISDVETAIRTMGQLKENVPAALNRSKIMGYEGIAAKQYFAALGKLVKPEFAFTIRSRRPPKDAFNAMISLGYTLVMYELYTAIVNEGLQPYFGFMHALRNHHPGLASDLLEEWRPIIVDSLVMSLVQKEKILPEHFETVPKEPGIFLTSVGRHIFLKAYEHKMNTINRYGEGEYSYRHSLRQQVKSYSQALMREDEGCYTPMCIR